MKTQSFYKERAIKFANYIIENKTTVRETAKAMGVSNSTVNQSLKHVLPIADKELSIKVEKLMRKKSRERI